MAKDKSNEPAARLKVGKIKITIWRNEYEKDGKKKGFYAAVPSCLYEGREGKLQDGDSFNKGQLLVLQRLAGKAFDRMLELEAAEKAREESGS